MRFDELSLSPEVLAAVQDMGFEEPTPIQAQAIPEILQGKDVLGASATGSGKTAAFTLPMLTRLGEHGKLRVLILEPTRELAAQVAENIKTFTRHSNLRHVLIHGGVGYGSQNEGLEQGVDILIATPGRLLDHMSRGTAKLDDLDFLVLDEVDRMLDMGFLPDVRRIVSRCPSERQTLFFSATMPEEISRLASFALRDPVEIVIGQRSSTADTIRHAFYPVALEQRSELIREMVRRTAFESVIVFTHTKAEADRLTADLKKAYGQEFSIATFHADVRQKDRTKVLEGFRDGSFNVIVATDLAARGLDISGVTHVINLRVPENPEDYVHRIGRTGRANKEGDAFTILTADEFPQAAAVERLIGQKIERRKLENFDYIYTTLLDDDVPDPSDSKRGRETGPRFKKRRRGGARRR
ncbi:MAG: DEAD/DEAH box helicase [Verrucomicrobiota bacterium]